MRAVTVLALGAVLVAVCRAASLGSVTCPVSNKNNTGCYCTFGCSIGGDLSFPWNSAQFPPVRYDANTMGNDTICAKITIPALASAAARNLSAYLGVTGQIRSGNFYNGVANNSEVTLWTAFTQAECANFAARVSNLVSNTTEARGLGVELCTTESCNVVNLPALAASNTTATNTVTRLPGACPIANPSNTSCYCSNGCSVNGDTSFPWTPTAWPPVNFPANQMGSDTICARIQVPNIDTFAGRALAAYLGVNGNIHGNSTNYFGADIGQTVTVYTAFTAAECASFMAVARALTDTRTVETSILLCNTSSCNSITGGTSNNNGGGGNGVDSSASVLYLSATIVLAALFMFVF
jgi:hypothetical protein